MMRSLRSAFLGAVLALPLLAVVPAPAHALMVPPFFLTKTDNRNTAAPGDVLTYEITMHNAKRALKVVTLKDVLPAGVTFVGASDFGQLKRDKKTVQWTVIVPGFSSKTVTVKVKVNAAVPNGTVLLNTVSGAKSTAGDSTIVQKPVTATGDLFVTQDSVPIRSYQLLGGMLGEAVLRLNFRAASEPVAVTRTAITVTGIHRSIDRLELYKVGETLPFAAATVAGCGADPVPVGTFCAHTLSDQLVIDPAATQTVLVRPRMKSDIDGAVSGDRFTATLPALSGDAIRATGKITVNNLALNDGDATAEGEVFIGTDAPAANVTLSGPFQDVVLSRVTDIVNANSDANGTSVPTGVSDVGQFRFTAAANANSKNGLNKAVLTDLYFSVNATNVAIDAGSFRLFNKADSATTAACTPMQANGAVLTGTASGSFLVACRDLATTAVNTELSQGTNETFVLSMNVTNPDVIPANVSALQVWLQNHSSPTLTILGPGVSQSHVRWLDRDAGGGVPFLWIEHPETVVKSTSYSN
jgi:uncharacterized repeat protein (TIGR01451 family)